MKRPIPFLRDAGEGPAVVCLHANASSSIQWRSLVDRLSPEFRVLSPDAYGAGKSPPWPVDKPLTLADEVALLEGILSGVGPVSLVGHSYGGAVALKIALTRPNDVKALALFEPTLFSLIEAQSPSPNDVDGIRFAADRAVVALTRNDNEGAARHFIDFWMGPGAYDQMPEHNRTAIAKSAALIPAWRHALFTEPVTRNALARINQPVLLMTGSRSPQSSHAVAERLRKVLPNVQTMEFAQLGHMGPLTHPELVNDVIHTFLREKS